ncbi:phosphonate utilization transcriptional regulator PhnR [Vibrio sp. NH-UV-68]|uniref:phosphonate utilization transcriptional regulator PhnR n=1 Tax=unclassified Vibrio TaxID=2614977 RepID=UPI0036F3A0CF
MQYVIIKDAIVEQIESGLLAPRQKLPAERKLAESFNTTRVTLREALSLLESEGRIYREDRRGWFISPQTLRYDPTQTQSFTELAQAQNRTPKIELISTKAMVANKQAATLLNLPPFSDIYRVDRVRYLEQRPVAYVINYIRPELFRHLLDLELSNSLTDIYRQHYDMVYQKVRYRISTSSLFGDISQALRATAGTPAMIIERLNYNQNGELMDGVIEYWRHDAISIESTTELNR